MFADTLIRPWFDRLRADLPKVELLDVHAHTGDRDVDGTRLSTSELIAALDIAGARGETFPLQCPDGYEAENDRVLAEGQASGGRLVAFCRIDPRREGASDEAARCLDAGALGVKLHPRAEDFPLELTAVRDLFALANERSLPIIIHAGHGVPSLGQAVLDYCDAFPNSRAILAHAGVSDLSWLWRHRGPPEPLLRHVA